MNSIKKAITMIISLAMLAPLTSCSSGKKSESVSVKPLSSKGGYTEKKLDFAYGDFGNAVTEVTKIGDKTGSYIPYTNELCYISKDGTRLFRSVDDNLEKNSDLDIYRITAASDSGFFTQGTKGNHVIDADGNATEVKDIAFAICAEFSESGRLFAADYEKLVEIDVKTGSVKQLADVEGESLYFFDIVGDEILYGDSKGAHCYNIEKNSETEMSDTLSGFLGKYRKKSVHDIYITLDICKGINDDIYIACEDGLFHYYRNGNYIEQLMDGLISRFGDPSDTLICIYCMEDGTLYSVFTSGAYSYKYDPELENAITSELKVYSLERNGGIAKLVSGFAAKNRNVKVEYQVGMKDGITYSDAMKELTTQIMTGNTPDVIFIDGLDNENLIEKNMLMDLSGYEEKWRPKEDLLDNVAKWNTHDDKLYSVACNFRIPVIGAEKNDLEKLKSFNDIADLCVEYRKEHDPNYTITDSFEPTDTTRMGLIYDRKTLLSGAPDKAAFEKYFDSCEKINTNEKSKSETAVSHSSFGNNIEYLPTEYWFASRFIHNRSSRYSIAMDTLNSFDCDLYVVLSQIGAKNGVETNFKYGFDGKDKSFIPECNIAVASAGKNHEEALNFIKYSLGEKLQRIDQGAGFPVNLKAIKWLYDEYKKSDYAFSFDLYYEGEEETIEIEAKPLTNDDISKFDEHIKSLDEAVFIPYSVRDIIETAAKKCMDGALTPEQAADETVKQLELKMKE